MAFALPNVRFGGGEADIVIAMRNVCFEPKRTFDYWMPAHFFHSNSDEVAMRSGIGDADPAPVGCADTGCPRSVKQRIKP